MHRILLVLLIAGCSSATAQPKQTVYDVKASLIVADNAAIKYITQPLCGPKHVVACSDAAVIAKIKAADQSAYDAVKNAETGNADDLAAANAAIAKLVSVTPVVR